VLTNVYVVVVVVVCVCVCLCVSCFFLSLLVFWWLCVCLPVSGFRLLWGASGWVIEVCGVFDLLVWAVTLCVFGSLLRLVL